MGYVADVFDEARLSRLPGRTAIGHVRYSTAGASLLANAQPHRVRHGPGTSRARAQRQPRQRPRDPGAAGGLGRALHDDLGLRGHPAPRGAVAGARPGRSRWPRPSLEVRGRVLAPVLVARGDLRRARSQRHPPALARHPRRISGRRLGDLRLRPDRREVRAGRRARARSCASSREGFTSQRFAFPHSDSLHLRARLLRPPRLDGLRKERRGRPRGVRRPSGPGAPGRGGRRRPGSRLRDVRGARIRAASPASRSRSAWCGTTTSAARSSSPSSRSAASA